MPGHRPGAVPALSESLLLPDLKDFKRNVTRVNNPAQVIAFMMFFSTAAAVAAAARDRPPKDPGTPSIMNEEPERPRPRRRGSSSPSPVPPYQSTVTPLGTAPRIVETPPLGRAGAPGTVVPGVQTPTGPVMTPPRPAGQGFQDRARDCFHAGTAAGVPPGQIGAYTRACVNQ